MSGTVASFGLLALFGVFRVFPLLAMPLQAADPQIWTDKPGYVAGESIRISGEGFAPLQRVTLRVTHVGGTAEARAGHEPFFAETDASGSFQATWSIDRHETQGLDFLLSADGTSGLNAQTLFARVGTITSEGAPDLSGGSVRIRAQGFNANEPVTFKVGDGHDHAAVTKVSDDDGVILTQLDLPRDNPNATVFTVIAASSQSGLSLTLPITDYVVVAHEPVGIPLLHELRAQHGLDQIGWLDSDSYYDFFVTWNSAAASTKPGQTRNACALFDTDGDESRRVDFAVCGQIQNGNADPNAVVQTPASPFVFGCDGEGRDRCGNPVRYGTPAQIRASVRSGTLTDLSRDANLAASTGLSSKVTDRGAGANSTLRIRIDKSFLPPHATLVNACSYASVPGDSEGGPLDCIVSPNRKLLTASAPTADAVVSATTTVPTLSGRVVYHSYVSYNDGTSQLFVLNLGTGKLTNISSGWTNLKDPMNAHWSPDGTKIVFMARPKKGGNNYSAYFDVFLYAIGQSGNPVDLTNTSTRHEEDPKFSPDGSKIVYKVRPSTLPEMNLKGNILDTIISSSVAERSMPYYTADATAVWFMYLPSGADPSLSSIHKINANGTNDSVQVDTPGVIDYYPIRDTIGQFLYSRTVSATNLYDQVFMYDGANSTSLPFNTADADYSDAFPAGTQYIVLSSTRAGGVGGYDLYIADRSTGAIWSMSGYNAGVNTTREELGASYTPN